MKNILLLFLVFGTFSLQAQSFQVLEEGQTAEMNGISYGYRIKSFTKKDVKNKGEFDRYEVVAYVTNNRSCDISIRLTGNETAEQLNRIKQPLIIFECANATGYRLTSKGTTIYPEAHNMTYKYFTKDAQGKNVENRGTVLAGYYFATGSTREDGFIVIVPPGEKPKMQARLVMMTGN